MNAVTFRQAWEYGGPLMWVLAALSVIAFAVCLYLFFAHRRGALRDLLEDIRRAKDPAAAGGRIADRMYGSVEWLADIAAINNSKIIESDPEPYLQDLAFFNIHTLGELRTFVRENRDDALYFAKQALTGIALDELSSIVGLYYICRAKLVRGDYNLRQLIVFFMLGDSTPKRAEQHANHILRLREKEQA